MAMTNNRYCAQIDDDIDYIIEGMHHRRMKNDERMYTYILENLVACAVNMILNLDEEGETSFENDLFHFVYEANRWSGCEWSSAITMGSNCIDKMMQQRSGNKFTPSAQLTIRLTCVCVNIISEYSRNRDEKAITQLMRWAFMSICNDSRILMLGSGNIDGYALNTGQFDVIKEYAEPTDVANIITFHDNKWSTEVAAWINPRDDDSNDLHVNNEYLAFILESTDNED